MEEKVIGERDIKKLLFVSLKSASTMSDEKFFAVFDKNGDYVELMFQNKGEKGDITNKVISPSVLTSKKRIKKALNLTEENFMSLKEACDRKYLSSCKEPLEFYEKCHCLMPKDVEKNKKKCDPEQCIQPVKVYIVSGKEY